MPDIAVCWSATWAGPFPSWQGYVVANIFGEQGNSVVQHASCRVAGLGVPVNSPPAAVATASGQRIDEPASDPAVAGDGIDPEVLKVTNHSIAEGMWVKHIVRKPDWQALAGRCSGYKSAHRMFRVHYTAPQFPNIRIRNRHADMGAIGGPHAAPVGPVRIVQRHQISIIAITNHLLGTPQQQGSALHRVKTNAFAARPGRCLTRRSCRLTAVS